MGLGGVIHLFAWFIAHAWTVSTHSRDLARLDVHHGMAIDMGAANIVQSMYTVTSSRCAVVLAVGNESQVANYVKESKICTIVQSPQYEEFLHQPGILLMLHHGNWPMIGTDTCTEGHKGYGSSAEETYWSDEVSWRKYGRITAIIQWKNGIRLCGIQFRFGSSHWGELHGRVDGDPYEVYLQPGEYLTTAPFFSRLVVDLVYFVSSTGVTYEMLGDTIDYHPNLGGELAYLAGYTHVYIGLRISDLAVYQTDCY